jgi:hypothetical protein
VRIEASVINRSGITELDIAMGVIIPVIVPAVQSLRLRLDSGVDNSTDPG